MARRSITLDFDEIRRQAEGYYALPEEARARVV
jgi:hypothetical protein